jgi:hypothetical protein
MSARILNPENLNSLEVIQVVEYMDDKYPNTHYDIRNGNGCVWVTCGTSDSMYFIFREGRIADIQVD